jgi:hypothetical protein
VGVNKQQFYVTATELQPNFRYQRPQCLSLKFTESQFTAKEVLVRHERPREIKHSKGRSAFYIAHTLSLLYALVSYLKKVGVNQ